ncbi:MAG: ergothioneine biosynthesis protein EgtB [Pirellulales bacterium]
MNANPVAGSATLLAERYAVTRRTSELLCEPLEVEDYIVQSMPDASPTRWHLAHTTWFFDNFVLAAFEPDYQGVRAEYRYLFNSYYEALGRQFPRAQRGVLTRPTVAEVSAYRRAVDQRMSRLLENGATEKHRHAELCSIVELGSHHEQQHQELMLTDLKHAFSCNPLYPAYRPEQGARAGASNGRSNGAPLSAATDVSFAGGLVDIGHEGDAFSFDNERPRHKVYLAPFTLSDRLITNGEYRAFIDDGGYRRADLWLSLGWATVRELEWQAPLYWHQRDGRWHEFTLGGLLPLCDEEPVCHVSYFEADAFARWSGARLPTEFEWEHAAAAEPLEGGFLERGLADGRFHPAPAPARAAAKLRQLFGEVWQWTSSSYGAYPGYRPPPGALGEYNGKFMCNQYVLRGGSCATPANHLRTTYRNFFPPQARWQFSGIRLARD